MSINRDFFVPKIDVTWAGTPVCTVRGLTPDDFTRVMSENAADMETLMETFERDKIMSNIGTGVDAEIDAAKVDNNTKMFTTLITSVPDLAAKIIACACDAPDAETVAYIRKEYTVPLQFEVLTRIAQATFIDTNGFKNFLGNVLALVANVSGQRETKTQTALSSDTAG